MATNVEARSILQGLFNKWNGKSEEKVEDVQTTIIAQPTKLYNLRFKVGTKCSGGRRLDAYFGNVYLCPCWKEEKEMIERDFNHLKNKGCSIIEIKEQLGSKYKIHQSKRSMANHKGNPTNSEYVFRKPNKQGRTDFYYRFDKTLYKVCRLNADDKTKEDALNECRLLISKGKTKYEISKYMTEKHKLKKGRPPKYEAPKSPMVWSTDGELLFNDLHTGLYPSSLSMIQTLHSNSSNPFTFADYVCQNLPRARPSVVNYICMNYDQIPFDDLINEGMKIMDSKRGF